ncbi:MAG: DEAD/DEAH box helicase [Desulfobacteraceae bacterium]|nr:MAG: DEAD/DEAH box helicase [Desulfobacteraceae bacterium]
MPNFFQFDLNATLLQAIKELGFEIPTPVQRKVIPLLLQDTKDLVVLAQTGTGKTAAYGLPLVQLIDPADRATQTVVLCPTRELCMQITKDLNAYAKYNPEIHILAVYGGSSIENQIKSLKRGAHIIVATPGRMNDLIRRQCAKLTKVQHLVLDEADEMLNMGFQEELEFILKELPPSVRTLLFSATMSTPVAAIARKYMKTAEEIIIGQRNAGAENVSHECYTVHAKDRYETLKRILDFHRSIYGIIFCRTRLETHEVASQLITDGYSADALHGDLSQELRDRVMKKFRAKEMQLLVATDVAARGLDVNNLTHVIHYNLPDEAEAYTHRSGRTGRAGKEGVSIVISNMREDHKIRTIEKMVKKPFIHRSVPSGHAVCESQLMGLLERLNRIDLDNKQIDAFMPAIRAALGDQPLEETLKRFLLLEFNRFLEYYKNARDLNQKRTQRIEPSKIKERAVDGDMVILEINLGHCNKLSPVSLISTINRATRGPKLPVGRIRIAEQSAYFEVAAADAASLIASLNRANYGANKIRVKRVEAGGSEREMRGKRSKPKHTDRRKDRKENQKRKSKKSIKRPAKNNPNKKGK